jgi:hypothetical protein
MQSKHLIRDIRRKCSTQRREPANEESTIYNSRFGGLHSATTTTLTQPLVTNPTQAFRDTYRRPTSKASPSFPHPPSVSKTLVHYSFTTPKTPNPTPSRRLQPPAKHMPYTCETPMAIASLTKPSHVLRPTSSKIHVHDGFLRPLFV